VGDVYRLHEGMIIPADSILIQAGHAADERISATGKRMNEKGIVCQEDDVTGEHDYKFKTTIT